MDNVLEDLVMLGYNICIKDNRLTAKKTDKTENHSLIPDKERTIKPILLAQAEGTLAAKDIRFPVAGFYDNQNVLADTCDGGHLYRKGRDFDSILWIEEDKIKIIGIKHLIPYHTWHTEVGLLSYGDFRTLQNSAHKFVPYVFPYKDGEVLIDFTVQYESAKNNLTDDKSDEKKEDRAIIIEQVEIWKMNVNDRNQAYLIADKESEEYKYVIEKNQELHNHYKSVESFFNLRYFSKENYKKAHKYKFEDFTVPDTEESLCYFWKDQKGRVFNYGKCVVYDKSKKGNIDSRNRSYINIYGENGEKCATVKFIGTPVHIEQKETNNEYFVLTQQECNLQKKSVVRLYKFQLENECDTMF